MFWTLLLCRALLDLISGAFDLISSLSGWRWTPVLFCQFTQGFHKSYGPHQLGRHDNDLNFDGRRPQVSSEQEQDDRLYGTTGTQELVYRTDGGKSIRATLGRNTRKFCPCGSRLKPPLDVDLEPSAPPPPSSPSPPPLTIFVIGFQRCSQTHPPPQDPSALMVTLSVEPPLLLPGGP